MFTCCSAEECAHIGNCVCLEGGLTEFPRPRSASAPESSENYDAGSVGYFWAIRYVSISGRLNKIKSWTVIHQFGLAVTLAISFSRATMLAIIMLTTAAG